MKNQEKIINQLMAHAFHTKYIPGLSTGQVQPLLVHDSG